MSFIRRLPKHGEAPLERLAVWADGGCVPAPRHLDGVEWALAVCGAAREAKVDLVTVRSARWVHYDRAGGWNQEISEHKPAPIRRLAPRTPAADSAARA